MQIHHVRNVWGMKHQVLLGMGFLESPGPEDSTSDTTVDSEMGYAESLSEFSEGAIVE